MKKITKDSISETAISLFLERGYNNVTITDICNECGITKPTFYKYAGSKEDLILNLYDITINDIVTNTYQFLQVSSHYEQFLIVFHTLIGDSIRFGSDLFSQMLISNLKQDHNSFSLRENLTRLCVLILQKAQENKEIMNPNPPEVLYNAIAHMFSGYELNWCIKNGDFDWADSFYSSLAAVLDVRSDLRDVHVKYSDSSRQH